MSNGNHMRAVGPEAAPGAPVEAQTAGAVADAAAAEDLREPGDQAAIDEAQSADDMFAHDPLQLDEYEVAPATSHRVDWLMPALAFLAIVGWSAFYGYAMRAEIAAGLTDSPAALVGLVGDWAVPVLLIGVAWLLMMRNSRAEARRFGSTAALLSLESRKLEGRLSVVNRELSLAREFLGTQSRELDSLGRIASERISAHANELQGLIKDNGDQVAAIGSASETALGNMRHLRDDLPVLATSARDVTNQIGNAGRTARDQVDALIAGFEQLEQQGVDNTSRVAEFSNGIATALTGFEETLARIDEFVTTRYDTLTHKAGVYRDEIEAVERQSIDALNERVTVLQSETKAIGAAMRQAEIDAMSQLEASRQRFHNEVTKMVEQLDALDREALAASQRRVKELHAEASRFDDQLETRDRRFLEEIARRQEDFAAHEAQAAEVLAQRLSDLDEALAKRREGQVAETEKLVAHSVSMGGEMERLRALIDEIGTQTGETGTVLAEGIDALGAGLSDKRTALEETRTQLGDLTDAGVRLLEIIQAGAAHSRETLSEAIGEASARLDTVGERADTIKGLMFSTRENADGLNEYLLKTARQIEQTDGALGSFKDRLADQTEDALARITGLRSGLARFVEESEAFAGETQDRLREALTALEEASHSVFAALDEGARERIETLAETLSREAVGKLDQALQEGGDRSIAKLEDAAAHASSAGREVTAQLRDQLVKVNELTVNLEQRIARAREQSEEEVGSDFARRMALITESLNSNAIDIASALSSDVSDTAWDAYMKGDRGIFTRRAVKLIDRSQSRAIAELYQGDRSFKATVDRYIHDFEAMLRTMLSTRDGNALAVTMLGSDAGKLYVVLAQAIERFRT